MRSLASFLVVLAASCAAAPAAAPSSPSTGAAGAGTAMASPTGPPAATVGDGPPAGDPLAPDRAPPPSTGSGTADVWMGDALRKVQPTASAEARRPLVLSAARNEYESFQVHVRASAGQRDAVEVRVGDFVDAHGHAVIKADGSVVVSREEYQDVSVPSTLRGLTGRVPDALIPAVDPLWHEARRAFPMTVPAGQTRSAWVDVLVPEDAPAGFYGSTVEVRQGGAVIAALPVVLRVWAFVLPSTATLRTFYSVSSLGFCQVAYGGYAGCAAFPGAGGSPDRGMEESHRLVARFLLDRRISDSEVAYAGSAALGFPHFEEVYGPLLDGRDETRLKGARLTSLAYVGRPDDTRLLTAWFDYARGRGVLDRLLFYHCDEPPKRCSIAQARAEGARVHGVSPEFRRLLTSDGDTVRKNGLEPLVDILAPNVAQMHRIGEPDRRPEYDDFRSRPHKELWWYLDCSVHEHCEPGHPGPAESLWPNYMIDSDGVENRVFQSMAFLYRVDGELYYATDHCWLNPCGAGSRDPWASVYAFGGQGDGTLFYPGLPARIGGKTPTLVSSIRLEHIRDGLEDHAYLVALRAAGEEAFAQRRLAAVVTSAHEFSRDGAAWQAARRDLGDRLHRLALAARREGDQRPAAAAPQ